MLSCCKIFISVWSGGEKVFFIKPLAKFIAALNSNSKPGAVAAAVSTAFLLALIPSFNILWPVLFIIALLVRLNWGFLLVFTALFKWLVPLIDPFVEPLGWRIMHYDLIASLIYRINEIPGLIFSGLNDSIMIGGLVVGFAAWIPLFMLFRLFIGFFRKKISPKIANSKFIAALKKAPILGKLISAVNQFSKAY